MQRRLVYATRSPKHGNGNIEFKNMEILSLKQCPKTPNPFLLQPATFEKFFCILRSSRSKVRESYENIFSTVTLAQILVDNKSRSIAGLK